MDLNALVDAWNSRDAEAIAALYAPGGARHQYALPETRLEGRPAVSEGIGMIVHAVPEAELEARTVATTTDGEHVLEWTFRGVLENDFGELPGRGQPVDLKGVSVITTDGDGLIVEERVYWDTATLMAQAGVLG